MATVASLAVVVSMILGVKTVANSAVRSRPPGPSATLGSKHEDVIEDKVGEGDDDSDELVLVDRFWCSSLLSMNGENAAGVLCSGVSKPIAWPHSSGAKKDGSLACASIGDPADIPTAPSLRCPRSRTRLRVGADARGRRCLNASLCVIKSPGPLISAS
jgi:hypothetical protein